MDSDHSVNGLCRFLYDPTSDSESRSRASSVLDVFIHHARNVRNICVYASQDVYAKFSLTYDPDEVVSTGIINGGGKNPDFNENLKMGVDHLESVLKCEIWMMSRARNLLEDQLLGFVLVPLLSVAGRGKVTQDYSLSSTDLFHSPAGIVRLTLSLISSDVQINSDYSSSEPSEIVFLDRKITTSGYSNVEFLDMEVERENQKMASEYFFNHHHSHSKNCFPSAGGHFLHLNIGGGDDNDADEMTASTPRNQNEAEPASPESFPSDLISSTITSLSEDRNSSDSQEKGCQLTCADGCCGPSCATSKHVEEIRDDQWGPFFTVPSLLVDNDAEQCAMQEHVVDLYMRSMQQFTDCLSKIMKPLMGGDGATDPTQDPETNDSVERKRKDGSRIFYGSRAFF